LRKLEAVETALKENAEVIVPSEVELVNVIGKLGVVLPVKWNTGNPKNKRRLDKTSKQMLIFCICLEAFKKQRRSPKMSCFSS